LQRRPTPLPAVPPYGSEFMICCAFRICMSPSFTQLHRTLSYTIGCKLATQQNPTIHHCMQIHAHLSRDPTRVSFKVSKCCWRDSMQALSSHACRYQSLHRACYPRSIANGGADESLLEKSTTDGKKEKTTVPVPLRGIRQAYMNGTSLALRAV
jgi:hypothetical protein